MLHLMYPWFLLALPLPYLFFIFFCHHPRADFILKAPFLDNLVAPQGARSAQRILQPPAIWWFAFLVWGLVVLASTNPVWLSEPSPMWQQGRDMMLAIDISGSMNTQDCRLAGKTCSRLSLIQSVATNFIKARRGDRLGLILFGSRAYLQTPLTFDHQHLIKMLQDATVGLAGDQTAIGDALGLSIKHLMALKHHAKGRVIVLLTDGVNNAGVIRPLAAAKMAHQAGIRIYTIGLAPTSVAQWPAGMVSVDPKTLKSIAQITGGLFFQAAHHADLVKVYAQLNALEPRNQQALKYRHQQSLYVWPLLAAWLGACGLFLVLMRRKQALVA
jgi:Ca-activated chloride channel homolog